MFGNEINEWLGFASSKGADGTRPTTTDGTSITPGASNTMGSYTAIDGILSSTFDVLEFDLVVHSVNVTTENRMVSLDVAIDPAGGTSFSGNEIIRDLLVASPAGIVFGLESRWTFPLRIPAGASVGVRAASLNATTTAIRVFVNGRYQPTRHELVRVGSFCQTFGVGTPGTVAGVSFTPGTTADGAWVEVGTLDKHLFYFDFGVVVDDTTMTAGQLDIDVAIGDATNKRLIIPNGRIITTASEQLLKTVNGRYARGVPGDKIYARGQFSGALDAAYSIAAYGVG